MNANGSHDDSETTSIGAVGGVVRGISRKLRNIIRNVSKSTEKYILHAELHAEIDIVNKIAIEETVANVHANANIIEIPDISKKSKLKLFLVKIRNQLRILPAVLLHSVPHIMKSSIIGAGTFTVYEFFIEKWQHYCLKHNKFSINRNGQDMLGINNTNCDEDASRLCSNGAPFGENTSHAQALLPVHRMPLWVEFVSAVVAGGIAGTAHGAMYTSWSEASYRIQALRKIKTSTQNSNHSYAQKVHTSILKSNQALWGTCVSHGLIHGCLFGSYAVTKQYLMELSHSFLDYHLICSVINQSVHTFTQSNATISRNKMVQITDGCIVFMAGGIAGIASEYITIINDRIDLESKSFNWIQNTTKPNPKLQWKGSIFQMPLRSICGLAVVLPSALGFVAFEYGHLLL